MALILNGTHDFNFTHVQPGDLIYRDGDDRWVNLPAGEPGQILQCQGVGHPPQWVTVSAGQSPATEDSWVQIQLPQGSQGFRITSDTGGVLLSLDAFGKLTIHGAASAAQFEENGMPVFLEGDSADHSGSPTAGAGANAGSTPPVPVLGNSARDYRGSCTFGTGSGAKAGEMVAMTFSNAFDVAPKAVLVTPLNQISEALQMGVGAVTTTGFSVTCNASPAPSKPNTTYGFYFVVFT